MEALATFLARDVEGRAWSFVRYAMAPVFLRSGREEPNGKAADRAGICFFESGTNISLPPHTGYLSCKAAGA
jgi:hypothetical protein